MNDHTNNEPPCATGCSSASAEQNGELAAIEAELSSFAPAPSRLDRDRTMFLAGQAAASRHKPTLAAKLHTRIWPISCAALTAVSVCLLCAIVSQRREIIALRAIASDSIDSVAPIAMLSGRRQPQEDGDGSMNTAPGTAANAGASRAFGTPIAQLSRLRIADSGPLSVRSLVMSDEPSSKTPAKRDWPQYAYTDPSPPLPYYKLLKQLQHQKIQ